MSYPDIPPTIKVESTINNPIDPAEVFGFTGRNKKLGRTAIVMKGAAITESKSGRTVAVPEGAAEQLREDNAELLVLMSDRVLAMEGKDFAMEFHSSTFKGGGRTEILTEVFLNSEQFREFPRSQVEVGN